ncbi:hypothetical protein V2J09_017228 [Rumex salicifolius]
MLKLVIRRRLIPNPCARIRHISSSLNPLSFDSDDDPPFTPVTVKSPKPLITGNKKKKKQSPNNSTSKSESAPNFPQNSDLPFDFRYSYTETNTSIKPIGFREPPRFSPFGPGRLDRKWTGTCAPAEVDDERENMRSWLKRRDRVLGEPLSEEEVAELLEKYRHNDCNRQINIGNRGVTHNMLDDIHNHWKRAEAVRLKCLGVPTLDMDNIVWQLEEKSGGKVIYRHINALLLYRGRNYDPKDRPAIPLMLWKPLAPIYPKLVKNVADGLTFEETKELRNRGLNALALMKLSKNGVYANVVQRVRDAFEDDEVVRLDCSHVGTSDCKRIGVNLRDLVPCVPILFKDEQIILWRGRRDEDQVFSSSSESLEL